MIEEKRPYDIIDAYQDQHNLESLATEAVSAALIDGQIHGYTDEWKAKVDEREHLQHGLDHVKNAGHHLLEGHPEEVRENLYHAICRLTMVLWHLEMKEMEEEN